MIRCIKQQLKDAEIHFITRSTFKDVLSTNPYIDKLHVMDDKLSDVIPSLKKENFDFIIDLHHNQRSWVLKKQLNVPSFAFHKLNIEKWLMVNFKINRLPQKHIVDRYLDVVNTFGVTNDKEGLDFFIEPSALSIHDSLPSFHKEGFIAFVIGAKHRTKRLPDEKIISLCKSAPLPVVLIGGPEDKMRGDLISQACGEKVYSSCGKTSLHESAALIKFSNSVITHDTGMMHIASAMRKKIISVWGNTIPEFGMYPYYGDKNGGAEKGLSTVVEVKNLSCRPCSKIGFDKCPKGHLNCLNKIDEGEIISRLKD